MSSQSRSRGGRGGSRGGGGTYSTRSSGGGGAGRSSGGSHRRQGGGKPGNRPTKKASSSEEDSSNHMRDEDILIAFMPYLKGDDARAAEIHEEYQKSNDQKAFLKAARSFLRSNPPPAAPQQEKVVTSSAIPSSPSAPGAAHAPPSNANSQTTTTHSPGQGLHPPPPGMQQSHCSVGHVVPPPPGVLNNDAFLQQQQQQPPPATRRLDPTSLFNSAGQPIHSIQQQPEQPPNTGTMNSSIPISIDQLFASSTSLPHPPVSRGHAPPVAAAADNFFPVASQQQQAPGVNNNLHNMQSGFDAMRLFQRHGGDNPDPHSIWGKALTPSSLQQTPTQTHHHHNNNAVSAKTVMPIGTPPRGGPLYHDQHHHQAQALPPGSSPWGTSPSINTTKPAEEQRQQQQEEPFVNLPNILLNRQQQQQQQQAAPSPLTLQHPLIPETLSTTTTNCDYSSTSPLHSPVLKCATETAPPASLGEIIGSTAGATAGENETGLDTAVSSTTCSSPPPPGPVANTITTTPPRNTSTLTTAAASKPKKEHPPAKRVWTHFEEQPGRIVVDGFSGENSSLVLYFAPRQELTAKWSLPFDYLNRRGKFSSLEQALTGLTVGLFRRGCTENGAQASIVSKKVIGDANRSYDYGLDPAGQIVRGQIPFYSPRTPGHVLFRLYWDHEPLYTLAMGPTLHIRVSENDFDSSIRFILSNFKGKKSNPTSLSSLNSLAQVLETPVRCSNESAARAVWGCIQESRKVVDACAQDHIRTADKLSQLEETVEELKRQVQEEEHNEDAKSQELSVALVDDEAAGGTFNVDDDHHQHDAEVSETKLALREKTKALMSGRASCERKWRDSQLAFASILKAAVTNPSLSILLRRDMVTKMRLEYELWCPLSEEFATPDDNAKIWYEPIRALPSNITAEDYQVYSQARTKLQMRTLGFEPNTMSLEDILFPRNRGGVPNKRTMDPGAVSVFNSLSAAMGQCYQELHMNEDEVMKKRELIRQRTEECVQECGAFPPGTSVVIFGSSANGFGSPKSDIDMCLQLPSDKKLDDDDRSGAEAMAKLAGCFEESGMKDVDTARLSARIPIIRYFVPDPLTENSGDDEEAFVECDLSMHNPLAVLNTGLLRAYADITPVTRVLASIIKRWAKARDINNPARHTLSSYGYIIMLLHFLTFHKRSGNGLVSPVAQPEGGPRHNRRQQQSNQAASTPLLPNLQWMDPMWPNFPDGTPYRELASLPRNMKEHPMEDGKVVNCYFYHPKTPNDKTVLQMRFPGQDLSLAILLASFFRYYAYEFDYKRYVVSLHSTTSRGLVEREVKAELDGWRNYSAALTIEDPFEAFYDVAHVLRGGYYHRIRREFAVAYSKIADAASGRNSSWNKGDVRDLSGQEFVDWICEPVTSDREQPNHP